jgi:hypothetical protein
MTFSDPVWALQGGTVLHPALLVRRSNQSLIADGIVGMNGVNDLKVQQSSPTGVKVDVQRGGLWFKRAGVTDPGSYFGYNDGLFTINLDALEANPRIDLIIAQAIDTAYGDGTDQGLLTKVKGTAAPSPGVPALPANAYKLAEIAVPTSGTILDSMITDKRSVAKLALYPDIPAVKVYKTSNQSIANTTDVALTFQTVVYDWTTAMYSAGANTRLTIQQAGKYTIKASVAFDNNVNGTTRFVKIYRNGVAIASSSQAPSGFSSSQSPYILAFVDVNAVAGDYFEVYAYQNSGGSLNVLGSTEAVTWFAAHRIA